MLTKILQLLPMFLPTEMQSVRHWGWLIFSAHKEKQFM